MAAHIEQLQRDNTGDKIYPLTIPEAVRGRNGEKVILELQKRVADLETSKANGKGITMSIVDGGLVVEYESE